MSCANLQAECTYKKLNASVFSTEELFLEGVCHVCVGSIFHGSSGSSFLF